MRRRKFIKNSSLLLTGSVLSTHMACNPSESSAGSEKAAMGEIRKNWAGNLTYSAPNFHQPGSIEELQELIKNTPKFRMLGTKHCFNKIADSKTNQISLSAFNKVISLDEEAQTVTIGSAMRYGELAIYLQERGYALHNLASLPHISVAGACATATHGSGDKNGNLATAISGLEMVTGTGEVVTLTKQDHPEKFFGAVVGLGGVGAVTKMTLDIQPTFEMRQDIYLDLPQSEMEAHFEEIMSHGYSVSLFTDWQAGNVNQVWVKRKMFEGAADAEFFGAKLADRDVHPILEISPENCTKQMGVAGPWYERMPHFRLNFTPSSGEELQSEFFIPREHAVEAIKAIYAMGAEIKPHLFISEVRSIATDQLWMSPCYGQDCVALHFTWKQEPEPVGRLITRVEQALMPFDVRPHWGKLFNFEPAYLQSKYEKLADFKALMAEYDPEEKFRNEFLQKNLYR